MCRLILSVDMLAQSVAVEIDASDVEPVKRPGTEGVLDSAAVVGAARAYDRTLTARDRVLAS